MAYPHHQQKKEKSTKTKKSSYRHHQQYNKIIKKFIKEEKKMSSVFRRLNDQFIKKMEKNSSHICFLHKWVLVQNHRGLNIIFKQIENEYNFHRGTISEYRKWLLEKKLIFRKVGTNDEYLLTKNYLKLLKLNIKRIKDECDKRER